MLLRHIDGGGTTGDFTFTLLESMTKLRIAWNSVTQQTIANCFSKAGMSTCVSDVQDESTIIGEEFLQRLMEKNIVDEHFEAKDFVTVDESLAVSPSADSQVVVRPLEQDPDVSDDDDDCGPPLEEVSSTTALAALTTLRTYFMQQDRDVGSAPLLTNVERIIEDVAQSRKVQTNITTYFRHI